MQLLVDQGYATAAFYSTNIIYNNNEQTAITLKPINLRWCIGPCNLWGSSAAESSALPDRGTAMTALCPSPSLCTFLATTAKTTESQTRSDSGAFAAAASKHRPVARAHLTINGGYGWCWPVPPPRAAPTQGYRCCDLPFPCLHEILLHQKTAVMFPLKKYTVHYCQHQATTKTTNNKHPVHTVHRMRKVYSMSQLSMMQ